jgi:fibronectin-binding autotransporter adhesin
MNAKTRIGIIASVIGLLGFGSSAHFSSVQAEAIANTGFESGDISGWSIGTQTGSLTGGIITQAGTGVSVVSGPQTFEADAYPAVGNPTYNGSPNPYYAPAVEPATWTFSPFGGYAVALQPGNSSPQFNDAVLNIGLSVDQGNAIKTLLSNQRTAACATGVCGGANPTNAAWITRTVSLTAGTTYTMSWNYIGTDYVPYNDGSITSLTPVSGSPTISVNNTGGQYALLGFTNPGTGDYSTGSFGSTGWQISTYQVSVTGSYVLGFMSFNLGDTGLSPVLLVDSQPGSTSKNGDDFGAVIPNNSDAPTVPPATSEPPATDPPATDPPATDPPATDPPATDPPATDPPATDPPATDPPATDPPATDPPATDPPATDPPATDPPEESTSTTESPRPTPAPETTTTTVVPVVEDTTTTVETTIPVENPDTTNSPTDGPLPITGSDTDFSGLVAFCLLSVGIMLYLLSRKKK